MEPASTYDALPYEAQPFAQSHPDRLATIATLFGMRPAPVRACRVLELGCAAGANLVPMAEQLPGSEFVGIDLSARQIADGRALVETLGLRNIDLRHQSLVDFDPANGAFDYIICHGVYSWVPDTVRDAILALCARHLAAHGVAFVSYNTYPGWRSLGALRDMLLYHAREFAGPAAQVGQARALAEFLGAAVPADSGAYGMTLRDELHKLRSCGDSALFHEFLEDANQPVYFHEFVAHSGRHALQYLAESDVSTMLATNLPKPVAETLARMSTDLVRTEQYMDFVRNRAFRQTLLCRGDVALERILSPDRMASLYVASPAVPAPVSSGKGPATTFRVPDGPTFTPGQPLVTAAFRLLAERWRQAVPFDDLCAAACHRAGVPNDASARQLIAADVLVGYTVDAVELRTIAADFVTIPTAKPRASRVARLQAGKGERVTNQRHEVVILDDLSLRLLSLLDGERDREALLGALVDLAVQGTLVVEQGGTPVSDRGRLRGLLGPAFEHALANLARCALLVA